MPIERFSINRFQLPQASAAWDQFFSRLFLVLSKVPVSRWQLLIRLLLVLSLSLSLARLFWLLVPMPVIPPAAIAIAAPVSVLASNGPAIDIAQLKSSDVFGKEEAPAATGAAPIPENQAVDSHLNLTLMGVIASNDEVLARAIINSGDKTEIYAIGNPLPAGNNATLAKVMSDRIIINNNGQYETLWLYQNDPNAVPISQAQMPQVQSQASTFERTAAADRSGRESTSTTGSPASPMAAEISRNLSDVVAMSIYREGGQVVGYKIRPGRDTEKFKSLGLQADDIVTAVNGMPLNNPAKIMEVYKNMGNTTSASLEIKRGGNVMTVDVVLQ